MMVQWENQLDLNKFSYWARANYIKSRASLLQKILGLSEVAFSSTVFWIELATTFTYADKAL